MREITSTQNALVKLVVELKSKASKRREHNLCVIEGEKEIEIAVKSGIVIEKIFLEQGSDSIHMLYTDQLTELFFCSSPVMQKMAIRDTKSSVIAIAQTHYKSLDHISLKSNPKIAILETIEKPGNLGSIFRTCDAADIDFILCTEMKTDLYNPNVIRNSLGCVFSQQIVYCSNKEAFDFCKEKNIQIFSSYLHTENYYYGCDFKQPTAIVFGTESTGISDFWKLHSNQLIKIPMMGKIDSMNVSNSASILLYEIVRQRIDLKN